MLPRKCMPAIPNLYDGRKENGHRRSHPALQHLHEFRIPAPFGSTWEEAKDEAKDKAKLFRLAIFSTTAVD